MAGKRKPIYGIGINDANYLVYKGKDVCPYYRKWLSMLVRCYSKIKHISFPTYVDCTVCEEWKYFSNFKKWVDEQPNKNWQSCELDKDILQVNNKCYSPEKTVFTNRALNSFLTSNTSCRGEYLLGVCWHKQQEKFHAKCNDPFNHKRIYVGSFDCELTAHKAWQAKKHEYACALAELQEDSRVADALRQRYAPDKDWTTR
ncbi:hypothetical protein [Flavobacterium sp.]|jgi:hypothetical protein|uniref:hypothetical protein n=1 Tax=Flavobacterium sp. TaxID=239 RepID=UPI0037C11364